MRAIRLGIKPHVRQELNQIAKDFNFADSGFVEDLFALVRYKGGGIPTSSRIQSMIDFIAKSTGANVVFTGIMFRKRVQALRDISTLAYFKSASVGYDSILAVQKVVSTMAMTAQKKQQSVCLTCSLMSSCAWGSQYASAALNSCKIEDKEWRTKVHANCPQLPEIEGFNTFVEGLRTIKQIITSPSPIKALTGTPSSMTEDSEDNIEEDMDDSLDSDSFGTDGAQNSCDVGGASPSPLEDFIIQPLEGELTRETTSDRATEEKAGNSGYGASHVGVSKCKVFETFVSKLTASQLVVFDLGAKFSLLLGKGHSKSFKPISEVSNDRKETNIDSLADLKNVTPSSHGLPEEIFEAKLTRKQLNKHQNLTLKSRKQLLYLLIDNSGSMSLGVNGQQNAILTRGALAGSLAMAVSKKVVEDGGIVYVRFFSWDVSRLCSARSKQELDVLLNTIALCDYNGGGTNITKALSVADKDISSAKDDLAKSEILMITDAEDDINPTQLKSLLNSREFNVLDVAGSAMKTSSLKNLATKYYKANEKELNLNKMVELL